MVSRKLKGDKFIRIDRESLTIKRSDKYLSFKHDGYDDAKIYNDTAYPEVKLSARDDEGYIQVKLNNDIAEVRAVHGYRGGGLNQSVLETIIRIPKNEAKKIIKAVKNKERYSNRR